MSHALVLKARALGLWTIIYPAVTRKEAFLQISDTPNGESRKILSFYNVSKNAQLWHFPRKWESGHEKNNFALHAIGFGNECCTYWGRFVIYVNAICMACKNTKWNIIKRNKSLKIKMHTWTIYTYKIQVILNAYKNVI